MRLTQALCKYRPEFIGYVPKFRGSAYGLYGKHWYRPPATRMAQFFVMRRIWYEEENMMYLKKPYISEKQEQALLQSRGQVHPQHWDDWMFKNIVEPEQGLYIADQLARLELSRSLERRDD